MFDWFDERERNGPAAPAARSYASPSVRPKRRRSCSSGPTSWSTDPRAWPGSSASSAVRRRPGPGELVVEPVARRAGARELAQAARRVRPAPASTSRGRSGAIRRSARGRRGVPRSTASPSSSNAPASGERQSDAVTAVQQRAFLRDEVEPVLQRVDEQDVVTAESRDAAGEVVALVEHHRLPVAGRPTVVDPLDGLLDLAGGTPGTRPAPRVTRSAWRRRRPAAPLGVLLEQPVVREESAHDVLRQVDAITCGAGAARSPTISSSSPVAASASAEAATALSASRSGPRDDGERAGHGRLRAEDLVGGRFVTARPAPRVEPARNRRHRRADLRGDVVGQHPDRAPDRRTACA